MQRQRGTREFECPAPYTCRPRSSAASPPTACGLPSPACVPCPSPSSSLPRRPPRARPGAQHSVRGGQSVSSAATALPRRCLHSVG
eukprot:5347180-Prymnesium_polylepis.1